MKKNFTLSLFAAFCFGALAFTGCDPDPVMVSSLTVEPASKSLAIGETVTLSATVAPADADNKSYTWSSSNDAVATVTQSGVVTAVAEGNATITATANDGSGVKGSCAVTVAPHSVYIAGDGFDIALMQTILASEAGTKQVVVDVAASGGIDKLLIEITSSSPTFSEALAGMGFDANADLANPSPLLAGSLAALPDLFGASLPFGDQVKNKTELPFDITTFIPMIFQVTAAEGGDITASFKLTVHDAYNHSDGETLKLSLIRETQLVNGGFEDWSAQNYFFGNVWYPSKNLPLNEDDLPIPEFWDTANEGLSIFSANNITMYDETDLPPNTTGSRSVKMRSIVFMSRFATGNIYTGDFDAITTSPLGANVKFGRPFTSRPAALKGWYKASPGVVTHSNYEPKPVGSADEYQIFIMLTDWTAPRDVNTSVPESLINPDADYVIGYGQISDTEGLDPTQPVTEWTQFNIPIVYKSEATPTHIVVVACASKYGDYLTGSTDSVLQVDDFELVY